MGNSTSIPEKSIHDFVVKDTRDKDVCLDIYKGKVLLVVNVASQCGYTNSNYTELSDLYTQFKDKGFEILAFPCNQFLKQEPGSSEEAEQFACTRFNAEYPIFHKVVPFLKLDEFVSLAPSRYDKTTHPLAESCHVRYVVIILGEVKVNGPNAAPVYRFLKSNKGGVLGSSIKWNFTKFLVDRDGHVIKRYGTSTSPLAIAGDIRKALGESED